jgi:hypothetical protein
MECPDCRGHGGKEKEENETENKSTKGAADKAVGVRDKKEAQTWHGCQLSLGL